MSTSPAPSALSRQGLLRSGTLALRCYPASMKRLDPEVREKAIEIANALLEQGYDKGKAIRIATAKSKEWWRHRRVAG